MNAHQSNCLDFVGGEQLPGHRSASRTLTSHAGAVRVGRRFETRWLWLTALCVSQAIGLDSGAAPATVDQSWPQWRGPHQNGVAPAGHPPVEWSESKNVKWKVKIPGEGYATPIIWGQKIFVLTAIPTGKHVTPPPAASQPNVRADDPPRGSGPEGRGRGGPSAGSGGRDRRGGPGGFGGQRSGPGGRSFGGGPPPTEVFEFVVLCLDRKTGQVLWRQTAREEVPHEGHHATGSTAAPSPVTDGQHVIAYFGSRGVYCYDMEGRLQWSHDFGDMRIANRFGEGSSPALYGDTLVINWDHEGDAFIAALDKSTGKILWQQPRDERTSWSTPLVVEHEGKPQVVTSATGKIRSYDLATGKLLWECSGLTRNVIPAPVAGHGLVYCTSGFMGNALLAIRPGSSGDISGSDAIVWKHNRATPYVPSPVLYGDKLYFLSGNNGVLSCVDALTGKQHYSEQRLPEIRTIYASPVGAAGKIFLVGRNGTSLVIKHGEEFELLATNTLDDDIDASPAVVGNELYLRGHQYVYCIAEN